MAGFVFIGSLAVWEGDGTGKLYVPLVEAYRFTWHVDKSEVRESVIWYP